MRDVNRCLLGVVRRAERMETSQLVSTFVDVGALLTSLRSRDHQVLYGRRGTGKTHVLGVLASEARARGDIPVSIDIRTLGSNGGVYADPDIPLAERASRLLADALYALHDGILAAILEDNHFDLGGIQPALDAFLAAICEVRIEGETEEKSASNEMATSGSGLVAAINDSGVGVELRVKDEGGRREEASTTRRGTERLRIHFGAVSNRLNDLTDRIGNHQIWYLIDEWSETPVSLQPFLADLLRRTLFPIRRIVVKIAAIEQRSLFRRQLPNGEFVGFELGADAAASLNLDEFMVFDSNSTAATNFFRELLARHIAAAAEVGSELSRLNTANLVTAAFTQITALEELVRASEGVPRDAINIAGEAAKKANDGAIAVTHVRQAARQWYLQSKESVVNQRPEATEFLHWVIESVIKGRKARAFLVSTQTRSDLIDFLYDSRVLHVIKRGVSSNETPGARYLVYSIDYGCYVDLVTTQHEPRGLFEATQGDRSEFVSVPVTDYRSIRRAVLNLDEFRGQDGRGQIDLFLSQAARS